MGESTLITKLNDLKTMVGRLTDIDAHEALFLLRSYFSIPKLTYILRTAPVFERTDILQQYDDIIRCSLKKILNVQINELAWSQCTLPINLGGLGLKSALEVALPAFLSSACASNSIMNSLLPTQLKNETNHF